MNSNNFTSPLYKQLIWHIGQQTVVIINKELAKKIGLQEGVEVSQQLFDGGILVKVVRS